MGGGGISRVLSGGKVFEKAGCSFSVVYGTMPAAAVEASQSRGANRAKGLKVNGEEYDPKKYNSTWPPEENKLTPPQPKSDIP